MNELISTCSKATTQGTVVYCIVSPRASKTEIVGAEGTPPRLKIKLKAPPVDGAANEALIAFLSKMMGVPKSHFEIISGQTAKQKALLIRR